MLPRPRASFLPRLQLCVEEGAVSLSRHHFHTALESFYHRYSPGHIFLTSNVHFSRCRPSITIPYSPKYPFRHHGPLLSLLYLLYSHYCTAKASSSLKRPNSTGVFFVPTISRLSGMRHQSRLAARSSNYGVGTESRRQHAPKRLRVSHSGAPSCDHRNFSTGPNHGTKQDLRFHD